jgi:hypothetical protein
MFFQNTLSLVAAAAVVSPLALVFLVEAPAVPAFAFILSDAVGAARATDFLCSVWQCVT